VNKGGEKRIETRHYAAPKTTSRLEKGATESRFGQQGGLNVIYCEGQSVPGRNE